MKWVLVLALLVASPVFARVAFDPDGRIAVGTPLVQTTQSVAVRSTSPAALAPAGVTAGGTWRQYYQIAATGTVRNISVCYQNIQSTGSTEADGPGSMIGIKASLETSAGKVAPFALSNNNSLAQFTFNHGSTTTPELAVGGGEVCSDPLWVTMVPGQAFYVRTYAPPGRTYAAYQGLLQPNIEYANNGSFAAAVASFTGDGVATTFNFTISQAGTTGTPSLNIVLPLRPNTLVIAAGAITAKDDGAGNWTGAGVASGTVNYTTGVSTITYSAPLPNGQGASADGLSRGDQTAPDDTMTKVPSAFVTNFYTGFIPGFLPTLAPVAILGQVGLEQPTQHTLCGVGDSINSAAGNTENKAYYEYMSNNLGVIRIGQGGERASDFAQLAFRFRRMTTLTGSRCSRVFVDYGSNDITQAHALATIQADLTAVWAALAAVLPNGFHDITQAFITPVTVSATVNTPIDNALYGPGTVAGGTPSLRNAVNAWICLQVGTLIGATLDPNAALENAPSSCAGAGDGTWKLLTYTFDGKHTSALGQQTILPAMFSPTGTNPAAVFAP